jgi:hypothetical protein
VQFLNQFAVAKSKKKSSSKPASRRTLSDVSVKVFIKDWVYRIDLDADYQREKIWSTKQQEDLLDSILIDIDVPKLYLVEVKDNKQFEYECIDGKQRMSTLLRFFKPEKGEKAPLKIQYLGKKYTLEELRDEDEKVVQKIEDYKLTFSIYKPLEEAYVREMFRRLQFGVRLNSGELLKSMTGTIRDFIYLDIGNDGPFLGKSGLSERRFSRPFTLAQICINSFAKAEPNGEYVRARFDDLQEFFEANHDLPKDDKNLKRIRKVLEVMEDKFGENALIISSRAVAVTGYLFVEDLIKDKKTDQVSDFAEFYIKLLQEIEANMDLLSQYKEPRNSFVMEGFQKYVLQASVEGYSIERRHDFLKIAFKYYSTSSTKGEIIKSGSLTKKRKKAKKSPR